MLMISDFYFGSYRPKHDSVVVGWRIDEYTIEYYGQKPYETYRLFVDSAARKSAVIRDFHRDSVFVVKERPC